MKKKLIILLTVVCVWVFYNNTYAQIRVINNKGTFFQIDTSKWVLSGIDIYNKNTVGNVGIGTFPNSARFVLSNGESAILPAFKLKYPFSGELSDSILTWDSSDSTVRKVNVNSLLNNFLAHSWKLMGNAGTNPATNFIGTTDNQRLVFRTNNTERMTILSSGNIGMGTTSPTNRLHINATNPLRLVGLQTNTTDTNLLVSTSTGVIQQRGILNLLSGRAILSLNGLTNSFQTFEIGTTGTDFNIVSSGTTHTFNFPDASSFNRGLLTNTDWIIFNNKIGTVTATTPAAVTTVGTTATINNTGAFWNANQLQGNPISETTPTNDQVLTWNGTSWTPTNSSSWSLTGNASTNPATNFLGTTDNQRLVFRTNNIETATILPNGNFGIGISTPNATLHINGSTINTVRSISDIIAGGNIETASNSVDIGSVFAVNQTTASQVLTLPSPTTTTSGRIVKVYNTGTTSFTMYTITIEPSKFSEFLWTGSTWIPSAGSGSTNNKKYVISAEYAGAIITPGPGTSHNGNLYGDNTGAVSPYYYMNYYHWESRSGSGPHTYQVIVRATLPNDFSEWLTSNAFEFVNMSQTGCSVDLDIYNVTSGASIYNGTALSNPAWTTNNIPNTSLTGWVTPGQTVAIVITLTANTNGTYSRIGDLILNYK